MKAKTFWIGVFLLIVAILTFYYGYLTIEQKYKSYNPIYDGLWMIISPEIPEQVRVMYFTELIGGMLGIIGLLTIIYGVLITETKERKIKEEKQ